MKTTVQNIWDRISGYKMIVSVILWFILRAIKLIWPHLIPDGWFELLNDILVFTGGMGAGHKVQKYLAK